MTTYDLALIGFGGVNRSLAELIAARGEALRAELGFGLRVVAITDLRLGSLMDATALICPWPWRWAEPRRDLRPARRFRGTG